MILWKDNENQPLKFVFPVRGIDIKIQHLTSYHINHCVTIHHNISLKSLPWEFAYRIFHQLLIIHFLINDLLLSKLLQTRHTGRGIWTKNNLFILCDSVFDGFFKLFLCFHTISKWYIQLFCKF